MRNSVVVPVAVWSALLALLASPGLAADEASAPAATVKSRPLVYLGLNAQGAEEWLRVKDSAVVIRVPRGEYLRRPYEPIATTQEAKAVEVESFLVDKFEVTNARFARFLAELPPEKKVDIAKLWREDVPGIVRTEADFAAAPSMEEFPVTAGTGVGAMAYAEWVGGRVPTQTEWEKAAGGPKARIWPWGDEPPDGARANFGRPVPRGLERVGAHAAGASYYGCMDMAGNAYDRVIPQRGGARGGAAPVMVKGGCWASPAPLNLRVLDLCMQSAEVADRTVGFRCVMDDPEPERPTRTAAPAPVLRLARDFAAAVEEAKRRRVPIFLSLLLETCGQCDRTRVGLFQDPRFVAYCNENVVVVMGHDPGHGFEDPHPANADGTCPLYAGLTCEEHLAVFNQGLGVVGPNWSSPGNFLLHPDRATKGAGRAAVLVQDFRLPKWGNPVDAFIAAFEKARTAMTEEPAAPAAAPAAK